MLTPFMMMSSTPMAMPMPGAAWSIGPVAVPRWAMNLLMVSMVPLPASRTALTVSPILARFSISFISAPFWTRVMMFLTSV